MIRTINIQINSGSKIIKDSIELLISNKTVEKYTTSSTNVSSYSKFNSNVVNYGFGSFDTGIVDLDFITKEVTILIAYYKYNLTYNPCIDKYFSNKKL